LNHPIGGVCGRWQGFENHLSVPTAGALNVGGCLSLPNGANVHLVVLVTRAEHSYRAVNAWLVRHLRVPYLKVPV
jgi:hypothetical protein